MTLFVVALLCVGILLSALVIPTIPVGTLVVLLVAVRSLADFGVVTGMRPGLLATLSLASAFVSIYALALHAFHSRGERAWGKFALFALLVIGLGSAVGVAHFGLQFNMLVESVRLLSAAAIFILAYSFARWREPRTALAWMIAPASVVGILGASGVVPGTVTSSGRLTGTFSHPNAAAAFFGISVVAAFALWYFKRDWVTAIVGILAAVALLLTGSLGGIAGTIVGLLVVVWLRPVGARRRRVTQSISVIIGLGLGYYLSGLSARISEFDWNGEAARSSSPDSFQWRLENWKRLTEVSQESPIYGFGIGSSSYEITPLGGPAHSLYFQTLIDLGLVGLLALVVFAIYCWNRVRRLSTATRWEGALLAGLVAFIMVNGSVSNLLGYTAAIYLAAAIIGIAWGKSNSRGEILGETTAEILQDDRSIPGRV